MMPPLARSIMPSQALHPRGSIFGKSSRRVADGAHAHAQALRLEQGINGAAGAGAGGCGIGDQPVVVARTAEPASNNRTNNKNSTRQSGGGGGGEGRSIRSNRSRFLSDALQMLSNRSSNRGRSDRERENCESGYEHEHGHGHGHGLIGDDGGGSPCPQKPLASFRSGSYSPGESVENASWQVTRLQLIEALKKHQY
jgi:hypothetical protein